MRKILRDALSDEEYAFFCDCVGLDTPRLEYKEIAAKRNVTEDDVRSMVISVVKKLKKSRKQLKDLTMTLEELAKKAIEESNGKTVYGVGNSSRGNARAPAASGQGMRRARSARAQSLWRVRDCRKLAFAGAGAKNSRWRPFRPPAAFPVQGLLFCRTPCTFLNLNALIISPRQN
ncbi:MAG: hypothetical protein IKH93_07905 [Bacteroidales bacterium]|nr:hypothetical protein [Bacteroidales bacterium]